MAKRKEWCNRIIDIKAIGKYIEKLRKDRGWKRAYLASIVKGVYDEKSIDDWERRGVLPNQESLISLAEIFEISIDDLLQGGKQATNEELLLKYTIFKPYEFKPDGDLNNVDLYTTHQKQLIIINQRLKELIIKYNVSSLSRDEDFELRFLFSHMCKLNDYTKNLHIRLTDDKYLDFIKILNHYKNQNLSKNAFYWEIQKYISVDNYFCLSPRLDDCISNPKGFDHQKFCLLEPWYKDMMLAKLQNFELLQYEPDKNEYMLKKYEETHGKDYDKEYDTKELIKYMIDNGATINPWFFSITIRRKVEKNIIDELESLYNLCCRPITIFYIKDANDDQKQIKATIENNRWNRFLNNYYGFYYVFGDERFTPKEIYRLLTTDSEKELVYYFAKKYDKKEIEGIKYEHLKARVSTYLAIWDKEKNEFLEKEKRIEEGLKEISILEEKLKKGEKTYFITEEKYIGPEKENELYNFVCSRKYELSYNEFLTKRNHVATRSLRKEIDNLTLEEIKAKYFQKEVRNYE